MCFHRPVSELSPRDLVLGVLWHLNIRALRVGSSTRTFQNALLEQASGLPQDTFRAATRDLLTQRLIFQTQSSFGLTPGGHSAIRDLIDVDRVIALERGRAVVSGAR